MTPSKLCQGRNRDNVFTGAAVNMRICSDTVSLDEIDIQTCKIIEAHKHVANLCRLRNFSFVTTFTQKQDLSGNKFFFLIVVRALNVLVAVYRERGREASSCLFTRQAWWSQRKIYFYLWVTPSIFAWYFPIMF